MLLQLALRCERRTQLGRSQSSQQHVSDAPSARPHRWQHGRVHCCCNLELGLLLSSAVRGCCGRSTRYGDGGPNTGRDGSCTPFNAGKSEVEKAVESGVDASGSDVSKGAKERGEDVRQDEGRFQRARKLTAFPSRCLRSNRRASAHAPNQRKCSPVPDWSHTTCCGRRRQSSPLR